MNLVFLRHENGAAVPQANIFGEASSCGRVTTSARVLNGAENGEAENVKGQASSEPGEGKVAEALFLRPIRSVTRKR